MKYGIQQIELTKRTDDTLELKADGSISHIGDFENPDPMQFNSHAEAQAEADKHPGFKVIEMDWDASAPNK